MSAVGTSMVARMCTRGTKFLYQLATGSIVLIPRMAVVEWMPADLLVMDTSSKMTWSSGADMLNLRRMVGGLIASGGPYCAGLTKGLMSASERVIRVVATAMPNMEVVSTKRQGLEVMRYEYRYVLAHESGTLNMPKDGATKIEIALSPQLEADIRTEILQDIQQLHDQGAPLAPGFLRQLGLEMEADLLEAKLQNIEEQEQTAQLNPPSDMAATAKRKKRLNGDLWSVDCIVDEKLAWGTGSWYRVRWLGYHPTWERYERAEGGQPGQLPFETWEPHAALVHTEALQLWEDRPE
jgi:hypothetical protein